MIKCKVILPLCLTALWMAGVAAHAQGINYGSSLNQGLELENRRYAIRLLEIQEKEVDNQTQYHKDLMACSENAECQRNALHDFLVRSAPIEAEKMDENATHQKTLLEIRKHWIAAGQ